MARNLSAEKRHRQSKKKKISNKHYKTMMKTKVKSLLSAVEKKEKKEAQALLKSAISAISKVKGKGVIHANTAARKISKLSKMVNNL